MWRLAGWNFWELMSSDRAAWADARRAAGVPETLLWSEGDPEHPAPPALGEVGHIDGVWYGVPVGTLVYDADGWHVLTTTSPTEAAALLASTLGLALPALPES